MDGTRPRTWWFWRPSTVWTRRCCVPVDSIEKSSCRLQTLSACILKVHLNPLITSLNKNHSSRKMAALTPGFIDIENMCTEAALPRTRNGEPLWRSTHQRTRNQTHASGRKKTVELVHGKDGMKMPPCHSCRTPTPIGKTSAAPETVSPFGCHYS